jgi:hypothetical protein
MDGFASDSVRMIQALRRDAQQPVQLLLFSATFNEKVKGFALKVVADGGGEEANQVRGFPPRFCRRHACSHAPWVGVWAACSALLVLAVMRLGFAS